MGDLLGEYFAVVFRPGSFSANIQWDEWKIWACIFGGVPLELLVALIQHLGKVANSRVIADLQVVGAKERGFRTGLYHEFHHLSQLLGTAVARSIRIILLAPYLPLLLIIKYIIRCCTRRSATSDEVSDTSGSAPERDDCFLKWFPIMSSTKFKDGLGTVVLVTLIATVFYLSMTFKHNLFEMFQDNSDKKKLDVYQAAVLIWWGGAIVMLIPGVPVFLVGSITTKVITKYFPKEKGDKAEVESLWVGCLIATAALTGAKFTANFIEYLFARYVNLPFVEDKISDAGIIAIGIVNALNESSSANKRNNFHTLFKKTVIYLWGPEWVLSVIIGSEDRKNNEESQNSRVRQNRKTQRFLILLLLPINFYWMFAFMHGSHPEYKDTGLDFYLKAIDYLILILGHVALLIIVGRMMPPNTAQSHDEIGEVTGDESPVGCCGKKRWRRIRYAMSLFAAWLSVCAFWLTVIVVQIDWDSENHDWKADDNNGMSEARLFGIALLFALACIIQSIVSWWQPQKIMSVFNCVCSLLPGAAAVSLCKRRKWQKWRTKSGTKMQMEQRLNAIG